jgi:hypothetical protein
VVGVGRFLFLTLSVLFFISGARAQEYPRHRVLNLDPIDAKAPCPTFDLRDQALGPIQNQGQVGWCYGVAASDILSNLFQQRISPATTALSYVSRLNGFDRMFRSIVADTSVDGGFVDRAVEQAAMDGVCFDKNAVHGDEDESSTGDFMTSIAKAAQAGKVSESMVCRHREQAVTIKTEKIHIFNTKAGFYKMVETMNKALARKRIVGIEYNGYFFTKKRFTRTRNHVSTIVGQKPGNGGQCLYLLRNTWGVKCYKSRFECHGGYYWIPRAEMNRTLIYSTVADFAK